MKKFFLLLVVFALFACEEKNVIEVKHTKEGYTSELLATIQLNEETLITSVKDCDSDKICVSEQNMEGDFIYHTIDLNTKEITNQPYTKEIEEIQDKKILFEDNTYTIYLETKTITDENTQYNYFYEGNGQVVQLLEYENPHFYSNFPDIYDYYDEEKQRYCFLLAEDNYISINEVLDGELIETKQIPFIYKDYELQNYFHSSKGILYVYKNDTKVKVVNDAGDIVFDENLDGYQFYSMSMFDYIGVFEKEGYIRIMGEEAIYDLGKNPYYEIRDDYILNLVWKEEGNVKELQYIDRKKNKTYYFSEFIDITTNYYPYLNDIYLVKDYNDESFYQILKIEDYRATLIDLPFTSDFNVIQSNKHSILFQQILNNELNLYLVKF